MDRYVLPFAQTRDEGLIYMIFRSSPCIRNLPRRAIWEIHARARPARKNAAVERRFIQLQKTQRNKLAPLLRQEIEILKSKGIAVNWHQLMNDLRYWIITSAMRGAGEMVVWTDKRS